MSYRIPTTPDLILLAIQNSLINIMPNGNSNIIFLTLEPDLNLLIPNIPFYVTIYDEPAKITNEETINPYTVDADSGFLENYPDCEMSFQINFWLYHGSDQAQRLNNQLNTDDLSLYPLETAIMNAVNLLDPVDDNNNLILSAPVRFLNRTFTKRDPITTGSYWSQTKFNYTARFIWNLSLESPPPTGRSFSSAFSNAFK